MSQWPSNLPQSPLVDGFSRRKKKGKSEFESQGGTTKSVVFFTAVPEIMKFRLFLDNDQQRQDLQAFYDNTLLFGTKAFDIDDPNTGQQMTAKFVGDPPNFSPIGATYWVAEFDLEVAP